MGKVPPDLPSRVAIAMIPGVLAIAGWAYSLDGRLRDVTARQEERGPRLNALEEDVAALHREIGKPSARLEERFEMRIARMEERLNNLHLYIIQFGPPRQRRGDIDIPPPFKQVN